MVTTFRRKVVAKNRPHCHLFGGNRLEKRTLIRNAKAIVTCDTKDHIYYDTDILTEGQRILKIGLYALIS